MSLTTWAQWLIPLPVKGFFLIFDKALLLTGLLCRHLYQPLKFILELPFSDTERHLLGFDQDWLFERHHADLRNAPDRDKVTHLRLLEQQIGTVDFGLNLVDDQGNVIINLSNIEVVD